MKASPRTLYTQNHSPSLSDLVKSFCEDKGYHFKRVTKKRIDNLIEAGIIKERSNIDEDILEEDCLILLPDKFAFPYPLNQILYHDPDISSGELQKKLKETLAGKKLEKEAEIKHEFSPKIPPIKIASLADEKSYEALAQCIIPQEFKRDKEDFFSLPIQTLKLYSKDVLKRINSKSDKPINKRKLPADLAKWFSMREKLTPDKLYKTAMEYAKEELEKGKRFLGFKIKGPKGNYFRTFLNLSEQGLALASHPFFKDKIRFHSKDIKSYNNTATGKVPSKEYSSRVRKNNLEDVVYEVSLDYLPIIRADCEFATKDIEKLEEKNKETLFYLWRNFNGESSSPLYLYDKSVQSRRSNPNRSRYKIVDAHQVAYYHTLAEQLWNENKEDCENNPFIINDTIFPIYSSKLTKISDKLRYNTFIRSPRIRLNEKGEFEVDNVIRKLNEFEIEYILMNCFVLQNPSLVYFRYSDVVKKEKQKGKVKRISEYIFGN
jgi:hypothetical protein